MYFKPTDVHCFCHPEIPDQFTPPSLIYEILCFVVLTSLLRIETYKHFLIVQAETPSCFNSD